MFREIRQMAYMCTSETFDATLRYWQEAAGAGPFWTIEARPENQIYRGKPTAGAIEAAIGYVGNQQVEIIRPLNDAPSPWTDALQSASDVPPAGLFHHFLLETDDFDRAVADLLAAGARDGLTAEVVGGRRVAYVDAQATFGCWVEVMQWQPFSPVVASLMRDRSRDWDGTNPRRSYLEVIEEAQARTS
ncbi:Glyoxalase/Bleomycin resistance protein/Dioxygenase superfamily protein [Pseudonocardia oroxyli]|uniref:Glyoxalase/Bleomycin resistance protein/Dioxygenase superfamily protein n=2 Tax=Pseudonocardia oroxyli TaxID=366584 RepID=A0A1G8D3H4_PSEOR|nr:Glyoxalase/Bleomycin resistance protein/Dioxygenase superfamily protein [Pseudonocardia oroxyli]